MKMCYFKNFSLLLFLTTSSFGQVIDTGHESEYFNENKNISFNFEYAVGNFIKTSTGKEIKDFHGFLLGGVEFEKHLRNDKSIYLKASLITDFPIIFPAPYDCFDNCENGGALIFVLGFRRTFKLQELNALSVGLGLSANSYYYNRTQTIDDSLNFERIYERHTNWGYGVNSDICYLQKVRIGDDYHTFGFGVNYSPTFFNSGNIPNSYLHVINLKFIYKLTLDKRKTVANKR